MIKKWISIALFIGIIVTNLSVVNTFAENIKSTSIESTTTAGTENIATDTVGTDTAGTATVISGNIKNSTSTAGEDKINNSDFVFDKSTGTITSYKGNAKVLTIPSEIDGVVVKRLTGTFRFLDSIDMFVDENRKNIQKVIIPSSVEVIDFYTFKDCTNLKEIELSEGLKKIGSFAFEGTSLEKINIPKSVIEIDGSALRYTVWAKSIMDSNNGFLIINNILCGYNGTDEIVKIPDGVKRITDAFTFNDKMKEVIVPDSVIFIESYTFKYSGLKSINIANKNVQIGEKCFGDNALITIAGKVVSKDDINKCTFEFDKSTGTITGYKGNETLLTIPSEIDGVKVLYIEASTEMKSKGYGILGDNLTVQMVTIPGAIKSIKSRAFQNSINLGAVRFYRVTNSIESSAFEGCSNLSMVDLGEVPEAHVDKDAFKGTPWQLQKDYIPVNTADNGNLVLAIIITVLSGLFIGTVGMLGIKKKESNSN